MKIAMAIEPSRPRGAGVTHRGHVRQDNQDAIVIDAEVGLYAVLDGMGGRAAGDVAARVGSDRLLEFVRTHADNARITPSKLLEFAIRAAGFAVYEKACQPKYEGMGATVVACLVVDATRVVLGHAGDSRAYRLHRGELHQLTFDHTLAQQLVDGGSLTPDEAARSFLRNILVQHLGKDRSVCPNMLELMIEPGDRLLLCSDGLYGGLAIDQIRRALDDAGPIDHVAQRLVNLTLAGEASDNISAIVIEA